MSKSTQPIGDRLYRGLLRVLPFDFRSEFGDEMEEVFREQRADRRDRGWAALFKMWWSTAADIFRMAPREHAAVLGQDIRYALRMMRRNPGFTLSAVLILGLAIGVNTSIFSAVYPVLMKPLPYLQGDNLVILRQPSTKTGAQNMGFSAQELADYRRQSTSLSGIVEHHTMTFTLFSASDSHRTLTGVVSWNFFDFLGVKPLLGRTFRPEDEQPGAQPVLVLSYEFWRKAEGGDPNILGRVYQMNDRPHIVIGVLPPIPQYPVESDVYMPTTACPFRSNPRTIANRNARMLSLFGRRKTDAPLEFCQRDIAGVAQQMRHDNPAFYPAAMGFGSNVTALREDLTKQARPLLLALLGAAGFVLLIACANVANLMLARMARREQELTIRTAVGAGSGRLLRQLLTESLLMALAAAAIGVLFAGATGKLLADFTGQYTARAREIGMNAWVLGFAVLCATATSVVFGSMSALYSRTDIASGLKENARTIGERRRNTVRSLLIAAQVAFSVILLIGAGLMVRSFEQIQRVNPGFAPQRTFAASFDFNWSKYRDPKALLDLSDRILAHCESQPGVVSAAVASSFPMDPDLRTFGGRPQRFQVQGEPQSEAETTTIRRTRFVTPAYFTTLGIPLVSGRSFRDSDRPDSPLVTIINRSLAMRHWPHEDPVGKRISVDGGQHWVEIVGVVGDVKEDGPDRDTPTEVYIPMAQSPNPGALIVRAAGDPGAISGLVRRPILDTDPQTAIVQFETLEDARSDSMAASRTLTRLFSTFGLLAFVIAVAGIGSMLALWVRQRTREIGIRMALGASPASIVGGIVRQGMLLVAAGLAAGVVGAFELTRLIRTLLFQVDPADPITFVAVAALLLAAAAMACLLPARRAAAIDPQTALRCD